MKSTDDDGAPDLELEAMRIVYMALKPLDEDAQRRVIEYVSRRLNLPRPIEEQERAGSSFSPRELAAEEERDERPLEQGEPRGLESRVAAESDLEGISPVAQKWLRRNDLTPAELSRFFSLGVDEIELVAKSVPGKTKKERMHNVLLLTGVAAYLGGGVERVADDRFREACNHYNAYDQANFAAYMKDFAAEASGSKTTGYSLTTRGLAGATDLLKQMINSGK
jgi:hypothetical protein